MLDTGVLVLNRVYQPVHITSVRRAFSLLYQGAAKAIDEQFQLFDFDSWAALAAAAHHDSIGAVGRRIRVPRVIVLMVYERMPKTRVRFSRFNIYARDENTCQYCGVRMPRAELNLDHVVPRSRGGATNWENVVCSCVPCNLRKGGRSPSEAGISSCAHLRALGGRRCSALPHAAPSTVSGAHSCRSSTLPTGTQSFWTDQRVG